MTQFDAPTLYNEVRDAAEAFEAAMCGIGLKAKNANPFFDMRKWDAVVHAYVQDFVSPKHSDFISLLEEADEALRQKEAA
jgi:hypothetical protein